MPELPEVETVRRSLMTFVRDRTITSVEVRDNYVLRGQTVDQFQNGLLGQRFLESCRHGKLLYFPFDDRTLCVHLGMTGQLTVRRTDRADTPFTVHQKTGLQRTLQHPPDKHTHISLGLDDGSTLHYRDVRKFGRFFWLPLESSSQIVQHFRLGVDPLTEQFQPDYLRNGLRKRRTPLKAALLDQSFIAGLGNIYVDEALFLSRLRPGRSAHRTSGPQRKALHQAIVEVLHKGIQAGGTTLRDFVDGTGQGGYNQEGLQIYGRYGCECFQCGGLLRRGVYGGRTTTWCSTCQK